MHHSTAVQLYRYTTTSYALFYTTCCALRLGQYLNKPFSDAVKRPRGPVLPPNRRFLRYTVSLRACNCRVQSCRQRAGHAGSIGESHHCLKSRKNARFVRQEAVVSRFEIESPTCHEHVGQSRLSGHMSMSRDVQPKREHTEALTVSPERTQLCAYIFAL